MRFVKLALLAILCSGVCHAKQVTCAFHGPIHLPEPRNILYCVVDGQVNWSVVTIDGLLSVVNWEQCYGPGKTDTCLVIRQVSRDEAESFSATVYPNFQREQFSLKVLRKTKDEKWLWIDFEAWKDGNGSVAFSTQNEWTSEFTEPFSVP